MASAFSQPQTQAVVRLEIQLWHRGVARRRSDRALSLSHRPIGFVMAAPRQHSRL